MVSRIWTIGHSTRAIEPFISMLNENEIKLIADVRMFPGSKRYPQFGREALKESLGKARISYEHFPELGGRRKARPDSKNNAWRNEAFRGYADYMETQDFQRGIDRLLDLAEKNGPTAIMCAEAVWWRCHRRIITDYLLTDGIQVAHIMGPGEIDPATLTPGAKQRSDGKLVYEAQ